MSSSQKSPIFLFMVGRPWSPCFYYSQEISYLCVANRGYVTVKYHTNQTVCSEFLFHLKLPVCLSVYLSVCLSVRITCVWSCAALLPAHFPLTFHFVYSRPVSGTAALSECVCCAVSLCSLWLVLCRGCAHSSVMSITPKMLQYYCSCVFCGLP